MVGTSTPCLSAANTCAVVFPMRSSRLTRTSAHTESHDRCHWVWFTRHAGTRDSTTTGYRENRQRARDVQLTSYATDGPARPPRWRTGRSSQARHQKHAASTLHKWVANTVDRCRCTRAHSSGERPELRDEEPGSTNTSNSGQWPSTRGIAAAICTAGLYQVRRTSVEQAPLPPPRGRRLH